MFQKLDDVVLKHEELTKLLMDPEVISDPKKIMEYNKALNSIDEVVKKYTYYKAKKEEMETLKEDLKTEKDHEMKEMMLEEIHTIEEEIPVLEEELKILLLPKDPNDDKVLEAEGAVEIAIRDDGEGMSPAQVAHLFEHKVIVDESLQGQEQVEMRLHYLLQMYLECSRDTPKETDGKLR